MTTIIHVYTGGTFDILHYGHIRFLNRCAEIGPVTVALNTDQFITDYKGEPPILSFEERKAGLLALDSVRKVQENVGGADSKTSILNWMTMVNRQEGYEKARRMVAIGSDWAEKDYYKQMGFDQSWLNDHGIMITYIPYTGGISTTEIKHRLRK